MRTIIEYMQLYHIHFYQKIIRKNVARANAALERGNWRGSELMERNLKEVVDKI